MNAKSKREGPISVPLDFDESMRRAVKVKPPAEGWKAYERSLKAKQEKPPAEVRKAKKKSQEIVKEDGEG